MSSKWPTTNLGAICKFTAGSAFKPEFQGCSAGDYPFIKVSDMNAAGNEIFINSASNYVNEIQRAAMKAKLHPVGAIVFAKIGVALTTNRRRLLTRPTIIDNNMMSATPRDGRVTSRFLYLLLTSIDFNTISAGTALPYLNVSDLERIEVSIPDTLSEQEAIARTLGDIDDKIDLNRRINQSLEAMAQAIFQSWFVDFDPVKAKIAAKAEGRDPLRAAMSALSGKSDAELDALPPEQYEQLAATAELFPDELEASELGEIPKGWMFCALPECLDINPARVLKKGAIAPYLDMANVPTHAARVDSVVPRAFGSGSKFINGDTLLARITPCLENGKTAYVDFLADGEVGWGSTEFIVLRPKNGLPLPFAYFLCRHPEFRAFAVSQMAGTSGRQRVPNDCFGSYKVAKPSVSVGDAFGRLTTQFMKQIKSLDEASKTLAGLRDTLLPKLLSGELSFKAIAESGGAA